MPDDASVPSARWRRPKFSDLSIVLMVVVIVVAILEFIPADAYMFLPGEALPVERMISVQGHAAVKSRGELLMTDVSLYHVQHLLEELYGRFNPEAELQPTQAVTGGLSSSQFDQYNLEAMNDSQSNAKAAALIALGYPVRFASEGPRIVLVLPGKPGSSLLKVGDILQIIDRKRIHRASDAARVLATVRPGSEVRLQVLRRSRRVHITVPAPRFVGPEIVAVKPGIPAASRLQAGDIVQAVSGHRVIRAQDVAPLISKVKSGTVIALVLVRHGRIQHVRVRTISSAGSSLHKLTRKTLLGIYLQDPVLLPIQIQNQILLPVKVSINAGSIGGPSAGLMFSLGIIERLQRHDLTRGCKIAGTGTIDMQGNVGAIGGARQKVIAAGHAGAQYFLVPDVPDNVGPARSAGTGATVVPVRTLRQALSYLKNVRRCT